MPEKEIALIIQGTPISPGLAEGIIHVRHSLLGPTEVAGYIEQTNVEEEICRLDTAAARVSGDLITLAAKVEREIESRLAQVFTAHQLILIDTSLKEELKKEIAGNLVSASSAVRTVFLRWNNTSKILQMPYSGCCESHTMMCPICPFPYAASLRGDRRTYPSFCSAGSEPSVSSLH